MPVTMRTIVRDALIEIGVLDPDEAATSPEANFGLGKLQRLLNNWNAERRAVYATAFLEFTFTPNLAPHTIGPTGATFTVPQRPVSIESAYVVLNNVSPAVNIPITVRDASWWDGVIVPALATTYPTDVYYQPDWPNGQLNFWPVPQSAWGVGLMARVLLDDTLTLDQTFTLPPGYQDAVTLTLAEMLATAHGRPVSPELKFGAMRARSRAFANNDQTPRLHTADAGMTTDADRRSTFNYLIGQ